MSKKEERWHRQSLCKLVKLLSGNYSEAIQSLIAERDALKARAEKAEAKRDALRKALDHIRQWSPREYDINTLLRFSSLVHDRIAALHGTAKQEPCACTVNGVTVRDGCEECSQEPKPSTCGECDHYERSTCVCCLDDTDQVYKEPDTPRCIDFQPRADAQKGDNA